MTAAARRVLMRSGDCFCIQMVYVCVVYDVPFTARSRQLSCIEQMQASSVKHLRLVTAVVANTMALLNPPTGSH